MGMWTRLLAAAVLLSTNGAFAADVCADGEFSVSVLDVSGVQCVTSAPCSGTYYASGLSQGVGSCPSGTSCALLPETPIMGCAEDGRSDLTYVNADGTLTKDGKSVTLSGASSSTSSSTTSSTSSTASSGSSTTSATSSTTSSNAGSGSGSTTSANGGSDASGNTTTSTSTSSASDSQATSNSSSWHSDSDSGSNVISPGSSSANQQGFDPGSILSDGSDTSAAASSGGLGIGAIIGITVGCLAVVAIAAGVRLLKKSKEAELSTPEGALEGYGGGGGMTPKENVLLL